MWKEIAVRSKNRFSEWQLLSDLNEVAGEERDVFAAEEAFGINGNGLPIADDHDLAGLGRSGVTCGDDCFCESEIAIPLDGRELDGPDEGDDGLVGLGEACHGGLFARDVGVPGLSLGL